MNLFTYLGDRPTERLLIMNYGNNLNNKQPCISCNFETHLSCSYCELSVCEKCNISLCLGRVTKYYCGSDLCKREIYNRTRREGFRTPLIQFYKTIIETEVSDICYQTIPCKHRVKITFSDGLIEYTTMDPTNILHHCRNSLSDEKAQHFVEQILYISNQRFN